jgi:hypothetical protein
MMGKNNSLPVAIRATLIFPDMELREAFFAPQHCVSPQP